MFLLARKMLTGQSSGTLHREFILHTQKGKKRASLFMLLSTASYHQEPQISCLFLWFHTFLFFFSERPRAQGMEDPGLQICSEGPAVSVDSPHVRVHVVCV